MKNKSPIQVIDLTFQVDNVSLKQNQLFEENNTNPANVYARLLFIIIRHRQIEVISNGNRNIEVKVI